MTAPSRPSRGIAAPAVAAPAVAASAIAGPAVAAPADNLDRFDVRGLGVIVTGGASGLGLAFVEALAHHGARVTMLDVDRERVVHETGRLSRAGLDVCGGVVDVTDHPALDQAFDDVVARYGALDVVFANAGIDPGPGFLDGWIGPGRNRVAGAALEAYSDERWNRVMEVNLNGIFATIRAAARHMRLRRAGRIIVTTSVTGFRAEPAIGVAYPAAKAAAASLMRGAALELAGDGIQVNAIAPGLFATNIGGGHALDPAWQADMAAVVPLQRVGRPDDIKGLALFLASPASAYITGQQIVIDGGWSLGQAG